ncbi:hypothetical protein G5B30_07455 [Sphingobacterium sp. SGG-5]|uniref:hypothetical protein n=1 Tax=Sphingobacterium sp. SGG-5 TaxID=2710881 RepID=UPI0013EC4EBA|nr:hypothetical protein [Sphingobacterium sp. SGG-5]NGM61749.1 hypothetical protein [Sphingobacterium sp. SGG-5]
MKTIKKSTNYCFLCLLLLGMVALMSCSKDDNIQPEETFDINNPEGYFIYAKHFNPDGSYRNIYVYEFMPGKRLNERNANGDRIETYIILDDNTINVGNGAFYLSFNGDLVTSNIGGIEDGTLIKAPESNQMAGKTFTGTYYKADESVLHHNFFYSFAAGGNTVDAGLNVGTTLRTENYTPIGNFAARAELENGDVEFMVFVNGKLEVTYKTKGGGAGWYHGTFEKQ